MKNAYAKKLQAAIDTRLARQQMIDMQMAKDAAMTVADTRDMEYTKAKLDQRLRQICGEHFIPWEERYK